MTNKSINTRIILASQSPFRAQLLSRLQIDFIQFSADIDESALADETPQALTQRLATFKAQHVLEQNKDDKLIVIGSDQVACHRGIILGKPHTRDKAIAQLSAFSDEQVDFYTAVSVLTKTEKYEYLDKTSVYFKHLSQHTIEQYVDNEDVLNCAGSFKSEGLGICLFKKIDNNDPTALIGLPMIWLATCLQDIGIDIPTPMS